MLNSGHRAVNRQPLSAAIVMLTTSCRREEDKRKRAEEAARYQEAAWVSADPPQDDEFWEDDVMGADGAGLDPLYCVACDRTFKSQGALDSHERCCLLTFQGLLWSECEGQVIVRYLLGCACFGMCLACSSSEASSQPPSGCWCSSMQAAWGYVHASAVCAPRSS